MHLSRQPEGCKRSQWLQWLQSAFVRVRCGSLALVELAANKTFQRTGANGRERPPALAMQKVVGSSPIIRSIKAPETGLSCCPEGDVRARCARI
jgi:hypothetical protein